MDEGRSGEGGGLFLDILPQLAQKRHVRMQLLSIDPFTHGADDEPHTRLFRFPDDFLEALAFLLIDNAA